LFSLFIFFKLPYSCIDRILILNAGWLSCSLLEEFPQETHRSNWVRPWLCLGQLVRTLCSLYDIMQGFLWSTIFFKLPFFALTEVFSGFSFFSFFRMIVWRREMPESAKEFRFFFLMVNSYSSDVSAFILMMLFHPPYFGW